MYTTQQLPRKPNSQENVLTPPLQFSGNKASAHLHCLEAATELMVKTHQGAAYLQRPAQQRLQRVLTFTSEPNTAGIYSKNNSEKRSPHFPICSAIASHVLISTV